MKTKVSNLRNYAVLAITMLLCAFVTAPAISQTTDEPVTVVRGKLIDQDTKKPIIFANVYVEKTSVGTVSNSEGEFILKVPASLKEKPINVSYMGYKTVSVKLSDMKSDNNVIALNPETINIKELIVRTNDPQSLIRGAMKNIAANYGENPYLCTAFYRESVMQNRQYVGVAEAVLDIYKSRYTNERESDRIKVFKGRKSQDVRKMDTLIFKLQGGHYVALLLDLAKNPQSFMTESFFTDYNYQPVTITNIEGRETYVIEFAQKKEVPEAFYEGRLYLDVNTLAIKRAEFSISPEGLKYADQELVKKKPAGTEVKTQSGVYVVDYRDVNGRWSLNHVRYEVKFKVNKKSQWFNKTYTSTVDLAITDKDTINVNRFKYSESLKPTQIFSEHVNEYYDENFWGNYNIIQPEEPIQEAVEKISKKMKRYNNS